MKKIVICDCSLLQSEAESFSFKEKTFAAAAIDRLGTDFIELPAPDGTEESFIILKTLASAVSNAGVCVALKNKEDAETIFGYIKDCRAARLQVAVPVSTVQMEYVFHMKAPAMAEYIAQVCSAAKQTGAEVEFSALDASRAEKTELVSFCNTAKDNGADLITLCDDAGIFMPDEFAAVVKSVKDVCGLPVFVKPYDRLKMATACAASCIAAGADGVKISLIGDSLLSGEAMACFFRERGDSFNVTSGLDITAINRIAADISNQNAHHSQSIRKEITADSFIHLDLGCDITDIKNAATALGYELDESDTGKVFEEVKRVCEKRETVGNKEFEAIIASTAMQVPSTYHLDSHVVTSGSDITAMASITLIKDGERLCGVSSGDGPIDASFRAMEQIIGHHYELDDFQIQAVTEGREAVGSALIRLRSGGRLFSGNGISTDIVGASIRAYLNALNKIVFEEN